MRATHFPAAIYCCFLVQTVQSLAASAASHVPGTSVEMPYLIAPVTVSGKLVSYAYISSRIIARTPSAAIDVRDKTPFIQDAYVRDVNGAPIADDSDSPVVDRAALIKRMFADAKRVMGGDKVSGVQIIQIQFSRLRPNPKS